MRNNIFVVHAVCQNNLLLNVETEVKILLRLKHDASQSGPDKLETTCLGDGRGRYRGKSLEFTTNPAFFYLKLFWPEDQMILNVMVIIAWASLCWPLDPICELPWFPFFGFNPVLMRRKSTALAALGKGGYSAEMEHNLQRIDHTLGWSLWSNLRNPILWQHTRPSFRI